MTARAGGIQGMALPDIERRVAGMVRVGTIMAVDLAAKSVRVKSGDIETTWLRWPAGRAGAGKRRWDAPEVGEQVVMISPGGDMRQALVLPGVYQDAHDAPSADANKDHVTYGDGTVIEYDRGSHTLVANLGDSQILANRSKIELTIGGTKLTLTASGSTLETPQLTVDAPTSTFTGAVTVQGPFAYEGGMTGSGGSGASVQGPVAITGGTVTHNSKNIGSTHTHSGVQGGGGTSGAPT
jgi:phage baseplate assembly protein gpV